jgi:hypothetical protein
MTTTSSLFSEHNNNRHRLTQREKNAYDKQWYKDKADLIDNFGLFERSTSSITFENVGDFKRKKINYDLFNNILDVTELGYISKQFEGIGELPAEITNRDILSNKVKLLMGMEAKMPFSWKVIAINEEATNRRIETETKMIKDYVVNEVMKPIDLALKKQELEATKSRKLSPEEQQQLQQQIAEERKAKTPDEVIKYMAREHRDPDAVLNNQLLEYLIYTKDARNKFNLGWKHSLITADDIYYVGRINGEPDMLPVNALFFEYDRDSSSSMVEDREWARYERRLSPSQVVAYYGKELTPDEIDKIYAYNTNAQSVINFNYDNGSMDEGETVRCVHLVWKSLMKVGFLTYRDRKTGKEKMLLVDENYKFSKADGDIRIEWEWVPETHECTKILSDIYVQAGPVPDQDKTLEDLWNAKLPYYGFTSDNLNSIPTAIVDRGKSYQYYYDIILYRVELLMASDKGKILAANIKAIPKSSGINTQRFIYFMEANKLALFNPNEEGNKNGPKEVSNMATVLDMSLASEIDKYISLAEYIERRCGISMGVTPQMEAQIQPDEPVNNTRQNLVQSSHIIQPYFQAHNTVKRNVLSAWLDCAKSRYSEPDAPETLYYVLDDMSVQMLSLDKNKLKNSRVGLYVGDATRDEDAKNAVINLAQAAMQNDKATLSDIIKVMKSSSLQDVEEQLAVADEHANQRQVEAAKQQQQHEKDIIARQDQQEEDRHRNAMEEIKLKATEDRKTKKEVAAITALGFNEDKDVNDNDVPDVLEVAKIQGDLNMKQQKLGLEERQTALDEKKFEHDKSMDDHQKKIDKEYVNIDRTKANKPKANG